MKQEQLEYHLATLQEQDPDYIVDVLDLTTEELLEAFLWKAVKFIQEEYE